MFIADGKEPLESRKRSVSGWIGLVDQVDSSWRDTIRPLLQYYTERTPGSFIEEKGQFLLIPRSESYVALSQCRS